MRTNLIITLCILATAALFSACGAPAANTAANKPANAPANANKPASTPAPASSPAASNTDKEKTEGSNKDLDFSLVNKTGYDIKGVSIGPAGEKDWAPEDEVLKGRTFGDGATLEIKFNPKATSAKWDLRVDWADGSPAVEWLNLDLTTIKKLTLKYDKATDTTSVE